MVTTSDRPSEDITVILHFGVGSFEQGFPVRAEIFENQRKIKEKDDFRAPPCPDIPNLYRHWEEYYSNLGRTRKLNNQSKEQVALEATEPTSGGMRAIQVPSAQVTNYSTLEACQSAAQALQYELKKSWFLNSSFQHLRDWISAQAAVHRDSSIPIMFDFRTGSDEHNKTLKKLPWHLWDLFNDLNNAEVVLLGKFQKSVTSALLTSPLKILAIFGSDEGELQLGADEAALLHLEKFGAKIEILSEPEREVLHEYLSREHWDILFFAGHSFSDDELKDGYLLIGKGRAYSIDNFREDLKIAVNNGLKMAIFNSCDGLGIADFLTNLNVSTVVVFREPVPDLVARKFLQEFLQSFLGKDRIPLYKAARVARNKLQWLESNDKEICPCADWLPIICQNPTQPELVWIPKTVTIEGSEPPPPLPLPLPLPLPPIEGTTVSEETETETVDPSWWKQYRIPAVAISAILGLSCGFTWYLGQSWGASLKSDYSSLGEASLIDSKTVVGEDAAKSGCENTVDKEAGTRAFASGNFEEATEKFAKFLDSCKFDPEAQIYYNNAQALLSTGSSVSSNPFAKGFEVFFGGTKTLRIAAIVPIGSENGSVSGNKADIALEMLRGIARKQELLNENRGINNKPLLVQIVDDDIPGTQDLSDRISTVGSDLINDPAILAAVGPYSSKTTELLGKELKNTELVAIAPTSTAVRNPDTLDLGQNVFRTSLTDAIAAQTLLDDIIKSGKRRVTILYDRTDPYSSSLKREFEEANKRKQAKIEIVKLCDLADSSISPDSCFRQGNPDALLWIPPPDVPERAMNFVLQNQNQEKLPIWAGDSAYGGDILQNLGDSAKGMRVFVSWSEKNDSDPVFSSDLGINWRTAMSYDATGAIAEALRFMGSKPGRQEMRKILLSPDFASDGILGPGSVKFALDDTTANGVGIGDRLPVKGLGVVVTVKCDKNSAQALCHY